MMESNQTSGNVESQVINPEDDKNKKRYCDKAFKVQLAKALKANFGEPDNFDKIKANKLLIQYDPQKILDYTNKLAEDIQYNVEESISCPNTKQIIELTKCVDSLTDGNQTQEIPMLLKLNSVSKTPGVSHTNNVNFDALNKYLYSAVSGSLDYVDMNYETKLVLQDTYKMLLEQVEKDTPRVLEEFRSKMSECPENSSNEDVLSDFLHNNDINPLNMPIEFLLQDKNSK